MSYPSITALRFVLTSKDPAVNVDSNLSRESFVDSLQLRLLVRFLQSFFESTRKRSPRNIRPYGPLYGPMEASKVRVFHQKNHCTRTRTGDQQEFQVLAGYIQA